MVDLCEGGNEPLGSLKASKSVNRISYLIKVRNRRKQLLAQNVNGKFYGLELCLKNDHPEFGLQIPKRRTDENSGQIPMEKRTVLQKEERVKQPIVDDNCFNQAKEQE
ncbi:hypothetical protein ANN_17215 [Periplaneta americana]|uniref:Uncharacterized protein n=1 Tax=Periplaneta americana TaxID=6978 RepID=A0ABQ8SSB1_PERAM|nr:hypothetical protein ANN_17215 [Periplaneta americana]